MKRTVVMDKTKCGILFLSIVGLLLLWLFKATTEISPVKADTVIVVNTTEDELNDDTDCSLREAI